ncbi:STAS domain-containing protein [Azohydromonas caseinilytica]|uniref:STAS domain-containing protein n=1 Tax=Azohydromonas caseinilytica TaxID=2728836 RepID=A0A848FDJ3_9BURK|nr:STAS domain-containing protein [Azohydromonas caseinilytica]NML16875.1 STAS domain-containing protein [Azohydromonas caseinilytica]
MTQTGTQVTSTLLNAHEAEVLQQWMQRLKEDGALHSGRIREGELQTQCSQFLRLLRDALNGGTTDIEAPGFAPVRDLLADISASRATQGFSPRETTLFIFSLKQPLFDVFSRHAGTDQTTTLQANWSIGLLLDRLGLYAMEAYQRTREELIVRQQQEIAELSTPVIKLWDGILALPLIGTLDSQRTQVVMENLLESIVQQSAGIAIIDITGVPTVDTLTAQHLLKTVAAARLMGADCIISGIRPQIAQTMVHLGVELDVISKATLADAFALALARNGRAVTKRRTDAGASHGQQG